MTSINIDAGRRKALQISSLLFLFKLHSVTLPYKQVKYAITYTSIYQCLVESTNGINMKGYTMGYTAGYRGMKIISHF